VYHPEVVAKVKWRIGDLGRFRSEYARQPRFELIDAKREGVTIWYGGEREHSVIPLATFRRDCVNWWDCQAVNHAALPNWFKPGARFHLTGRVGKRLIQAVFPDQRNSTKTFKTIDIQGSELEVRRTRFDYASCLALKGGVLVMIGLRDIIGYGYRRQTRWDLLQEDGIIDDLYDLYDD